MRHKYRGLALWALLAGLSGQLLVISGAFYLGVDYGKTKEKASHEVETAKLTSELNILKKQSREKVSEARNTQDMEISTTDEVIREGIKQGGWWNENVPQDGVDVIWGNSE